MDKLYKWVIIWSSFLLFFSFLFLILLYTWVINDSATNYNQKTTNTSSIDIVHNDANNKIDDFNNQVDLDSKNQEFKNFFQVDCDEEWVFRVNIWKYFDEEYGDTLIWYMSEKVAKIDLLKPFGSINNTKINSEVEILSIFYSVYDDMEKDPAIEIDLSSYVWEEIFVNWVSCEYDWELDDIHLYTCHEEYLDIFFDIDSDKSRCFVIGLNE